MKRYKSKYGVLYEITPDGSGYLLSKIHTGRKIEKGKEVLTERKESYLRSSFSDCFDYMKMVDVFDVK